MKISKDCLDEALRALKDFSRDELKSYINDVFTKAKTYNNMSNMRAFSEAMKEINNDRLKSYFESTMNAANNAMKTDYLIDKIKKGKANLQNISVKIHSNQSDNIAAAQMAAKQELEGTFFDKVTPEETSYLSSGENDAMIADAFDDKKVDSKEANLIAKLWKEVYFPERNANMITSNAIPFEHINQDRSFRNIHDSNKMIMGGRSAIEEAQSDKKFSGDVGKQKWVDTVKKRFDLINSDAVDMNGNIDDAKLTKIIGQMYDDITTNKSGRLIRDTVVDRKALINKTRRRLQPKSMRDFLEYNKEYGQGNLMDAMMMDMQTSGNKIGMARIMGDHPDKTFLDLAEAQQKYAPKTGAWKEVWNHQADINYDEVKGSNKVSVSPTLAQIDANLRTVTSMSRLPLVTLRSLPDINNMAVFAMNHGYNYFDAFGTHIKNAFDLYPSEDRKYLAKLYSGMFKQHLGSMSRAVDSMNTSSVLNKISTAYFKLNLLHRFDMSNKMSSIYLVSKGLGRYAKKSFDELPLATKNWWSKFLEPEEWELLRGKTKKGMLTVDNVNALTDAEVKKFYESGNKLRPLHEIKNDLYRRVHAMAQIATENTVLNPTEFEKAFLLQGTKPGTVSGTAMRQIMQFKMFTFSFIDKVLIQGYKAADANQQKLSWAMATMVGGLPLAYGVMLTENLFMGKSMPDISKMNIPQAEKFLVELITPGLALFSGMLDPRHQNSDMVMSLLGSPSLRLIGNALATFWSLGNLNPKAALKHFKDTMNYVAPLQTTPLLSPWIREMMGDKGHLEPGQQHYFGK